VLSTLDRIYLPDARIHTGGAAGDASSCGVDAAKLSILDLAGNLLPDWDAAGAYSRPLLSST